MTQQLAEKHMQTLSKGSSISEDVIAARGYRTITVAAELEQYGFAQSQRRAPGLLLPLHPTDGGQPTLYVYRPDNPRERRDRKTDKRQVLKYELPRGTRTRLDCPPVCQPQLADPKVPLWITEGQKKADSLASRGLCAIALLGVWNWKSRNSLGGTTFSNDWDYIALDNREIHIVYDSDVVTKASVQQALRRLVEHLQRKGALVDAVYLPQKDGHKVGVDDWFAAGHTVADLQGLVQAPRPLPKPATPRVRLLDEAPPTLSRPLMLIKGVAYAATWLWIEITTTEAIDPKTGEIIRLAEPRLETRRELFVVRQDGTFYGPGAEHSLDDLDLEIKLPEIPRAEQLWRKAGVLRYVQAHADPPRTRMPDPAQTFEKLVDIIAMFIDFSRSLADQRTMAQMIACYVLATWFLDAFNVIGFIWPNGDRGSGKTVLITLIAELSYLGQVILAAGSFAALRDMADYGALLAFDDAENLANPRLTDPDKRALLLAGDRRGATVPLKELNRDKQWRTRYVNAYCPRCFSAIHMPDPVLASRTIVVPLIRTADRSKGNADLKEYSTWPHDRERLLDDLWSLGLAHLHDLGRHDAIIRSESQLTGRNLEPWRAILAVAHWLTEQGVGGLWQRMDRLSVAYQNERPELEASDITLLALKALRACAISAIGAISAIDTGTGCFLVTTAQVRAEFDRISAVEEVDTAWMGTEASRARRIGRILSQMRLPKAPRPGGKGSRRWRVELPILRRLLQGYGLPTDPSSTNGTNGSNGTNGTNDTPGTLDGGPDMIDGMEMPF